MIDAHIDQNTKATGIGLVQGTNDFTVPLHIDPMNNELLVEVIPCSPLSALVASRIHLDDNTHQIAAAVTNDASEIITPLTVDLIVGLPCLRIEY